MASYVLSFMGLITMLFVVGMIAGSESSNFPLQNCSTQEMDILALFYYDISSASTDQQVHTFHNFLRYIDDTLNTWSSRIHQASIFDSFSMENLHVNVSSWYLQSSYDVEPFRDNNYLQSFSYTNVEDILLKKIVFVQRLFSDMSGVRENVTHIAVIFLDGSRFSYEDNRNIPHILEQESTDIKIFVVVIGGKYVTEIVQLSDTLLMPYKQNEIESSLLGMAVCQVCRKDWFMFEHSHGIDSYSCYSFHDEMLESDWIYAMNKCTIYGGFLVTIETPEELNYLRNKLSVYIKERAPHFHELNNVSEISAQVYIGLQRDSSHTAKRFQWSLQNPLRLRPLILDHWMNGYPSGRYINAGAVWEFVWSSNKNNFSNGESNFIDGWVDIGKRFEITSVYLCEVSLPRKLENTTLLRITPASRKSFNKTLTNGGFMIFDNNIVSVATQLANSNFLRFLQQEKQVIPLFDCGEDTDDPRYISYIQICDYVDNCSNRRDETMCFLDLLVEDCTIEDYGFFIENLPCSGVTCCDGTCLPLEYVNDGKIDCPVCMFDSNEEVNDESEMFNQHLKTNKTCALICNCYVCIQESKLNNGRIDCTGSEGPIDETIGKLEPANTCYNLLGRSVWAPRCVYVKDKHGGVIGCRDMSHLKICTDFECLEGYFKCPKTYCIPQHYILDGTADCPTGEDEQSYNIEPCSGNFACWNSKICLHPDLVCDGHPECPYEDDEVDCHVKCAQGFRCVAGTVTVSTYNRSIALKNYKFVDNRARYLDLSGIDMSSVQLSTVANNLTDYVWSNCQISNLSYILYYMRRQVLKLDLSFNHIQIFERVIGESRTIAIPNIRYLNLSYNTELVFQDKRLFQYLEILDLSGTRQSFLDEYFFDRNPNIKYLYLSHTRISNFVTNLFPSYLVLRTLDLRGLDLKFRENMFNGLTITRNLYTDNFQICCEKIRGSNIPYTVCHSLQDTISSCYDLVAVNVQRILLWVVAVLALLGNMTVIVYRVIWDRSVLRTGFGLFVTNLGISDLFMSAYLFIISGADYYYREVYVLYDKNWRESGVCKLAGFLATLSCETSIYFIFLITLDRFLVMKFPFGQIKFSNKGKMICLSLSWVIGLLLALVPIVFKFEINSYNAMCLGLPLTTQRLTGWQYSFAVFIVQNPVMVVVIAYGQRAIFSAMSKNRIASASTGSSNSSRRTNDIIIIKQLSLVALFNFLCWFPIGIMGSLSLSGHIISNEVYAWIAVLILPINSAANPILYTIPAVLAKWQKYRTESKRSHSSSK